MKIFQKSSFERSPWGQILHIQGFWVKIYEGARKNNYDYDYNHSAARQTRTDDPLVNSQLSFGAQYRAANLLYHAELERRTITANPRTK